VGLHHCYFTNNHARLVAKIAWEGWGGGCACNSYLPHLRRGKSRHKCRTPLCSTREDSLFIRQCSRAMRSPQSVASIRQGSHKHILIRLSKRPTIRDDSVAEIRNEWKHIYVHQKFIKILWFFNNENQDTELCGTLLFLTIHVSCHCVYCLLHVEFAFA